MKKKHTLPLFISQLALLLTTLATHATEILIEAESGTWTAPMQRDTSPQASQGAYLTVPETAGNVLDVHQSVAQVTLEFEVDHPGQYQLWGKVFTPGKPRTREDSFFVTLAGQTRVWRIYDWADNWVWRRFTTENPTEEVFFDLSKGTHVLTIHHRVAGTHLDQIRLISTEHKDPYTVRPSDFRASDATVYENLSPYFDMPTLHVPQFPDRDFNIVEFGAVEGGEHKVTDAIRQAIAACHEAGGGRVVIPEGTWLTGPIHMRSFVNLHISKGAVVKFSQDLDDYLPVVFTRWEGMECYNYSAPIYGNGLRNIAITGDGLLDGQGEVWWEWKYNRQAPTARRLYQMIVDGVPPHERILGTPEDGMRPNFVQFISCQGILIENVTFRNGPMWTVHPVYCSNMIVRGMKVITVGPNNDGINPDSTRNLLIEDCYFSTGDDCVVLKSGLNEDGWRVGRPTENVVIRNIFANEGHGGVVCGSEMSGSVRNVYAHDCVFVGTDRGFRVKSMRGRGGVVENIWIEDIKMKDMGGQAIRLNMFYGSSTVQPATDIPAAFRNFYIKNIECDGAARAIEIIGLPELAIENIHLENLHIRANEGIRITDGQHLSIKNLTLETLHDTPIVLDRVNHVHIEGASIASSETPWVKVKGEQSSHVTLRGLQDQQTLSDRIEAESGPLTFVLE